MIAVPFTNMAISLSGGGYRATTFHLGTLSYLNARSYNDLPLLENVKILSTISGGTLTGVMYALKLAQGETFLDCYQKLYFLLQEDKLVDLALEKLNATKTWKNKHKTRDLINAFSEVYNEIFYDEATFQTLNEGAKTHLNDAIFGASEFTNGLQFRLQKVTDDGLFGDYYLSLPTHISNQVRLADAAASSSCFPGGFEPMIMPNDYGNGPSSPLNKQWEEKGYQKTAIMDGGIIDNQGIVGVKLAEDRNATEDQQYVGTYIVSDVCRQKMKAYTVPEYKNRPLLNLLTIKSINITALILFFGLGLYLLIFGNSEVSVISSTVVMTVLGTWLVLYWLLFRNMRETIIDMFGQTNTDELMDHLKVINRTPLPVLFYLVKLRATTVMKMVSDVFLKRIRALQISSLFQMDEWKYRVVTNNIYLEQGHSSVSPKVQKVIDHANSMPTTLWFSEQEKKDGMLDDLITCGQLRTCQNLKAYLEEIMEGRMKNHIWKNLNKTQRADLKTLYNNISDDWNQFNENPHWLFQSYQEQLKPKA